jgi:cytochrome c peroxidase
MQRATGGNSGVPAIAAIVLALSLAGLLFAHDGDKDLLKQAKDIFGPLPKVMTSGKNPVTPEKVTLGKELFYETRISVDGTVSCSRCHPIGLYAADGYPGPSSRHVELHPSPEIMFPSSHSSPNSGCTSPSPQHGPNARQSGVHEQ